MREQWSAECDTVHMGYTEKLHEAHKCISQETHFCYSEVMWLLGLPYSLYAGFTFSQQRVEESVVWDMTLHHKVITSQHFKGT